MKKEFLPGVLFQLIPRTGQAWDAEQKCSSWSNSAARAIVCGFIGLSWPSFLHLELAHPCTVHGPPAAPAGNWIRAICAKSFPICYQLITLVACCQAWTCSFVSISCTYWLDLLCSVGEDILWFVGKRFFPCGEGLVNVTWAGEDMSDGDGIRLSLLEEEKSFAYVAVRGENPLGLKINLLFPSEEGAMGCPGWQHSAWKRCTQNNFPSLVSCIIKMLYVSLIQLQICLFCALVSVTALYPRSLLLWLRQFCISNSCLCKRESLELSFNIFCSFPECIFLTIRITLFLTWQIITMTNYNVKNNT